MLVARSTGSFHVLDDGVSGWHVLPNGLLLEERLQIDSLGVSWLLQQMGRGDLVHLRRLDGLAPVRDGASGSTVSGDSWLERAVN